MKRERKGFWEYYIIAVVIIVVGLVLFKATRDSEIEFAKGVFNDLIEGRESVQNDIDWPVFQILTQSVGTEYVKVSTENEKQYFRKAFIANFSLGFKSNGGKYSAFTNWRIVGRDNDKITVAADFAGKNSLLFAFSKKLGKRRLVFIRSKQ
jgi:hypothetical protein